MALTIDVHISSDSDTGSTICSPTYSGGYPDEMFLFEIPIPDLAEGKRGSLRWRGGGVVMAAVGVCCKCLLHGARDADELVLCAAGWSRVIASG